jgi:hypothetical protein
LREMFDLESNSSRKVPQLSLLQKIVQLSRTAAFDVRRAKAALSSGCKPHPVNSLPPEATGAVMEVTKWPKPTDKAGHELVTARVCRPQRK